MILGQVISGTFDKVILRKKSDVILEIGSLAISEIDNQKILLQVTDLIYGSQLSQLDLELVSGMRLEEHSDLELEDKELRSYTLGILKPLISINDKQISLCKTLPGFLSNVREVEENDLKFLTKPSKPLLTGYLRSGSKMLNIPIYLDSDEVLEHHILIPAQTGRGKSNLTKCLLKSNLENQNAGILVLDPHDEYFGRNKIGLKDFENVTYYTAKDPPSNARNLRINLELVRPSHFLGTSNWSEPQVEMLYFANKKFGTNWVASLLLADKLENFTEGTLAVIKRRLLSLLDLEYSDGKLISHGIFRETGGDNFISEILNALLKCAVVIIDTSSIGEQTELLVGSLLASEIFRRYKSYKADGSLENISPVSIVLEEAVRVLGKDTLDKGPNIFSTIAREGRKFKVGLIAITQLPSLMPREILANMGTKIILGIEMSQERNAVIDSAAQDLTNYNIAIASQDKGEALITSQFTKFPIPISIPNFEKIMAPTKTKPSFSGMKLSNN